MSTNVLLFAGLFLLVAVCLIFIVRIELRLRKFFRGSRAQSLESVIADMATELDALGERADTHAENLTLLDTRLQKHGRGVKLVRFNPYGDTGSNQSFAVAIMNKEGDGVVFSSLYSRERMSVFAKPIAAGASDIELTPEERSVVEDAQKNASL